MTKKILSLALCLMLIGGMLISCGSANNNGSENETTIKQEEKAEEKSEINKTEIEKTDESSESIAESKHIGMTLASMTFPYYVRMHDQFIEEIDTRGWEMTFLDSDQDASKELNALQDMVNNDVDAIIASTFYLDGLIDVFEQAKEKDIPVFVIGYTEFDEDSPLQDLVTFSCGTEHYDAGYLGGTWTASFLQNQNKDTLKMAIMIGTTEQMQARAQGFVDALEENGIDVEVLNKYDTTTREDGMRNSEDALTAYPELELIYGVNAQASLGAYDATVGANREEVWVVGYDGEDEEIEKIDGGGNYIATITQNPKAEATTTIEVIDKVFAGKTVTQIVKVPAGIYCSDGQLESDDILNK